MNPNTTHLPNNTDHTIDRALATLRDAQPPSGLNARVLASLEHRATQPQRTRIHISARFALWSATAAAVIAIASLIAVNHRARPSSGLAAGFSPLNTPSASTGALAPAHAPLIVSRHPEQSAAPRRTSVFVSCSDHATTGCPIHDGGAATGMSGITQDPDAQALIDLHAPSHPAPPLPLTAQEKLFLRMSHYSNATELAELNPMIRAQQDAAETADFKAFFPDPPRLKQPGDDE